MSEGRNYSEEFERYLKGEMTPEEAHVFERNTLEDPFAMEALEGLETQDPVVIESDLQNLRKKISSKKETQLHG